MAGRNYAVLIGINQCDDRRLKPLRYAEKDCFDFKELLARKSLSAFAPEDVRVLAGADATKDNIEEVLYRTLVTNAQSDDKVLVYFSGHGFIAGEHDLAYLGTHDVNIDNILRNPNQGLRMGGLHDDVLMKSRARHVIFILDCCHSGALTPNSGSSRGAHQDLVGREFFSTSSGKIAIFSCPPDSVCRESPSLRNGIFTHFLLRGLRGEAAEPHSGDVTTDSLLAFVRAKVPDDQPPGSCGQIYGRIVLTSPGKKPDRTDSTTISRRPTEAELSMAIAPLRNPLDSYVIFVDELIAKLKAEDAADHECLDRRVLEVLRTVSKAEFLFLLRFDRASKDYVVKARSEIQCHSQDVGSFKETAFRRAIDIVDKALIKTVNRHNISCDWDDPAGGRKRLVIIPLISSTVSKEFMVVYGIDQQSSLLDDACCNIFRALYSSTLSLTRLNPSAVKAAVLDNMKKDFSHVPLSMYDARFALFEERLRELTIHFQPVIRLQLNSPSIHGWEALARDPCTQLAPADIFHSAQLWGRRFLVELDTSLSRLALLRYREARTEARLMRRQSDAQDLSINVYPSSLLSDKYFETLREAIDESGLPGENVTLELLEKEALPDEARDLKAYRARLAQYSRELQVTFGIDDFGVAHSSIQRLARLGIRHVKLDRELLHVESPEHAIKFVIDMISDNCTAPVKVIVEGFDGKGRIDLGHLYRLGVRYIQGYDFGKAGANLYRMEEKEVSYINNLLIASQGHGAPIDHHRQDQVR